MASNGEAHCNFCGVEKKDTRLLIKNTDASVHICWQCVKRGVWHAKNSNGAVIDIRDGRKLC